MKNEDQTPHINTDIEFCVNNVNGAFHILQHSVVQKRITVPKLVTDRITQIINQKKTAEQTALDQKLGENLQKLENERGNMDSYEKIMEGMPKGAKTEFKHKNEDFQAYSKWCGEYKCMQASLSNKT